MLVAGNGSNLPLRTLKQDQCDLQNELGSPQNTFTGVFAGLHKPLDGLVIPDVASDLGLEGQSQRTSGTLTRQ